MAVEVEAVVVDVVLTVVVLVLLVVVVGLDWLLHEATFSSHLQPKSDILVKMQRTECTLSFTRKCFIKLERRHARHHPAPSIPALTELGRARTFFKISILRTFVMDSACIALGGWTKYSYDAHSQHISNQVSYVEVVVVTPHSGTSHCSVHLKPCISQTRGSPQSL